jgi:site-specific DNA-methyltransferase (adenine-specific)
MAVSVIQGDCIEVMRKWKAESVDAIVCDPPYFLEFMGKEWDKIEEVNKAKRGTLTNMVTSNGKAKFKTKAPAFDTSADKGQKIQEWHLSWVREALRVLKPGGHLIAFGGTRTYHRLASAVEDAGFEIRDTIAWLQGKGFPKGLNVSKAMKKAGGLEEEAKRWDGWGTSLKPGMEPAVLARKPLAVSVIDNVLEHGTGAMNINACRIPSGGTHGSAQDAGQGAGYEAHNKPGRKYGANLGGIISAPHPAGRWPSNVIHDGSDEVVSEFPRTHGAGTFREGSRAGNTFGKQEDPGKPKFLVFDKGGSTARFFYCAKASPSERGEGNNHPTVKPVALMEYLLKLVVPPGGIAIDPFCGSGTTLVAAVNLGINCIGIEKNSDYTKIAKNRIEKAKKG